ncbi:MAG: hypothetical protein FWE16_03160, partial [Firmicutes bacterium]|nr:hypothetical protein [Bacillota bacterium]
MTTPKKGYAGFIMTCLCVLCVVTIAVTSIFVVANQEPVAGNPTPPPVGTNPSIQNSLFNLDGTINGQVAANILRDLNDTNTAVEYRGARHRLFPDHGTGHTLSLSQTFWRVAHVDGDRIMLWAWNAYRLSVFHQWTSGGFQPIHFNYITSPLRTNLLNDFNELPNTITTNSVILPTEIKNNPGTPNATSMDRIWIPTRTQLENVRGVGVAMDLGYRIMFRPHHTSNRLWAWTNPFGQVITPSNMVIDVLTPHHYSSGFTGGILSDALSVLPALYLDRQILEAYASGYTANNRTLFNENGILNPDAVELLYNKVEINDRTTPFRVFPDTGTGYTLALSRTYFRIAHIDSTNGKVALIAETAYRRSAVDVHTARAELLNDFGNVNQNGRYNVFILPAPKETGNIVATDRVWLPSFNEIRDEGVWGLDASLRGFVPQTRALLAPLFAWLRTEPEGRRVDGLVANGSGGIAPSIYLDTLALFNPLFATFQDGSNPLARVSSPEEGGASATRIGIELANPGPTELTF